MPRLLLSTFRIRGGPRRRFVSRLFLPTFRVFASRGRRRRTLDPRGSRAHHIAGNLLRIEANDGCGRGVNGRIGTLLALTDASITGKAHECVRGSFVVV